MSDAMIVCIFIYSLGAAYSIAKAVETIKRKKINHETFKDYMALAIAVSCTASVWPLYLGTMSERPSR